MAETNATLLLPSLQDATPIYITIFRILRFIVLPVFLLVYYIAFFLYKATVLILRPLHFLALPLILIGRFTAACFIFPFHFLARFETIYIYLSTASLVGLAIGAIVALLYNTLYTTLDLSSSNSTRSLPRHRRRNSPSSNHPTSAASSSPGRRAPRTAKEYRQQKQQQQQLDDFTANFDPASLPSLAGYAGSGAARGAGSLLSGSSSSGGGAGSWLSGSSSSGGGRKGKARGRARQRAGRGNLLTQTIMEEVDSSEMEDEFGF
ncbi:hypothetical protein K431DRAFT_286346 [Polychaeton citri CBS 116435]|uniref:Uncharacterized protein n=1 Tax=Polychaeton citri CBS 116435 TaxID=1314669 RepID=A0A9P4UPC5_9PEZI|nr:hypothetical protein K431DRAFT_286346 [Polychaeton citri CBS 116435]